MKIVQTQNGPRKEFTAAEINAMPKSARPIHRDELTPEKIAAKYADKRRTGKTAKDRKRND